ncbi:4017_t:CDS:10 [Ambispora leptoticha]|uniref:4017_t:CDS:1 n=1 Tax=Ambispora leptoticha TaxID=144679 RepID=A0A9N9AYL6_9GLOM|nr:4017_t:CDS:10 [Ambispora leptoticha]
MTETNLIYLRINDEETKQKLTYRYVDLASASLGATVVSCNDEFFAEAKNLLKPGNAVREIGKYTENGAWMDGWETRRHNPLKCDWVIIKLGFAGHIAGFDIDTTHFNGNQAPAAAVNACYSPNVDPGDETKWDELLPKVNLNATSHHYFGISETKLKYTHVKLNIYPDGGVARFRVYGKVSAILPADPSALIDLAFVGNEGHAVACSDQHYGSKDNLLLPGRGINMGDGWETKRSREPNHNDWVIVKLGRPGYLETAEIDTAHFKGNYPKEVRLDGCFSESEIPDDIEWIQILGPSKLGPHKQHIFKLVSVLEKLSHVKMTIYPDGGVKRLRILGRRELQINIPSHPVIHHSNPHITNNQFNPRIIVAERLTHSAFAAYGQVIQSFTEPHHVSPTSISIINGIKVTPANQGTARKYNNIARVINFRQTVLTDGEGKSIAKAEPNLSVFRCKPATKLPFEVKLLERHSYSSQMFIPMTKQNMRGYLVIVCLSGNDDRPDLTTLKAFIASRTQGINYNPGVWHHPMISLEETTDFVCLTHESGVSTEDCEEICLEEENVTRVEVNGFGGSEQPKRKVEDAGISSQKENNDLIDHVCLKERHCDPSLAAVTFTSATTSTLVKRVKRT